MTGAVYRHPGILAKMVTTLDVLSGGRAWLGIGAAWNEEESRGLGIPFPPVAERFERLEETLQICLQMWRGDESPYQGRHYQLERPLNHPRPLSHAAPADHDRRRRASARRCAWWPATPRPATCSPARTWPASWTCCARTARPRGATTTRSRRPATSSSTSAEKGERADAVVDQLGALAEMGFGAAIGSVANVWDVTPLEIIGSEVIPQVAGL